MEFMYNISSDIIKISDGLFLFNKYNKKKRKIARWFFLALSLTVVYFIILSYYEYKKYGNVSFDWETTFAMFFLFTGFFAALYLSFYTNEIIFDINKQKIIYKHGFSLLIKTKTISINEIIEVSINHSFGEVGGFGGNKGIIKYNIDLIDNKLNAYKLFECQLHNDEVIIFAKYISELINVRFSDRNNVEGYVNIYKKRVI